MSSFSRLVRFLARDGRIYYGDAILPNGATDIAQATRARIIDGDPIRGGPARYVVTEQEVDIRLLLAPLAPEHVRTVRCLGLNYAKHAAETGFAIPKAPVLFYKPATAITGPLDPIPIPAMAQQSAGLDWEAELVVVMGRVCRDVTAATALDYVLGYTVGNDVSHRPLQLLGGQWSLGKSFDGWAPLGPGIVAPSALPDPQTLRIFSRVNGRTMQDSSTSDMIFRVADTIALLSSGVTLLPGDLIFTGTPEGVGMGRKPPVWLRDGDVVEVGLEGVGSCTNRVEFCKPPRPKV